MADPTNRLEVTDRDGWHKLFPLHKAIVHIGSDPRNDIVLEHSHGGGVAPRHLQLIPAAAGQRGYRLVNMGDSNILVGETPVTPRSIVDLADGDRLRVGEFTLTFLGGGFGRGAGPGGQSSLIGLEVHLPQTQLSPNRPIEGYVVVRNLGDKPGAQFRLEVEHLDSDCYDIGPGPVLFPQAERQVFFRLTHPRRPKPPAGDYRFDVIASAPLAYPGESTSVSQLIRVLPYYSHKLRLITSN
jgi:hypothetical protein